MTYSEVADIWTADHQDEHGLFALQLKAGVILNLLPTQWRTILTMAATWLGLSKFTGVLVIRLIKVFTLQGFFAVGDGVVSVNDQGLLTSNKKFKWIGPKKPRLDVTNDILEGCDLNADGSEKETDDELPKAA